MLEHAKEYAAPTALCVSLANPHPTLWANVLRASGARAAICTPVWHFARVDERSQVLRGGPELQPPDVDN